LKILSFGVVASLAAGLTGSISGMSAELGWPLSEANLDYSITWGIIWGLFGALINGLALVWARRERLWWLAIIGSAGIFLLTCVSIRLKVITSLG